jgi:DNA-binding XRE family transcriptional regulator
MIKIITDKRNDKMMTRAELASAIGVTVSCIQAWETGKRKPRPLYLRKLKKVLSMTTDEVFEVLGGGDKC